jgi:hypothetical protein
VADHDERDTRDERGARDAPPHRDGPTPPDDHPAVRDGAESPGAEHADDAHPDDANPDDARPTGWTLVPAWAISHPVGTGMLMLIGVVMGAVFFAQLRVDLLPQIVFPQVRASVTNEGVDPQILEQTVTRELEAGLAATENATRLSSTTREGNASVLIEFDFGADLDVALADASAALERVRARLPDEADPPVIFKADPSEIPVVELAVTGEALDLVSLRDFAERDLAQRLLTTPGVAAVNAVGGRERELIVTLDPARIRGLGVAVRDVVNAVTSANRDEPGGSVTTGGREVLARTQARFRTADELRELRIPLPGSSARRPQRRAPSAAARAPAARTRRWLLGRRGRGRRVGVEHGQRRPGAHRPSAHRHPPPRRRGTVRLGTSRASRTRATSSACSPASTAAPRSSSRCRSSPPRTPSRSWTPCRRGSPSCAPGRAAVQPRRAGDQRPERLHPRRGERRDVVGRGRRAARLAAIAVFLTSWRQTIVIAVRSRWW